MVGAGRGGEPASKLENGKAAKVDKATPCNNAIGVFAVEEFNKDIGDDISDREEKETAVENEGADLPDLDGADVRNAHSAAEGKAEQGKIIGAEAGLGAVENVDVIGVVVGTFGIRQGRFLLFSKRTGVRQN